jgi:hypothetical protein
MTKPPSPTGLLDLPARVPTLVTASASKEGKSEGGKGGISARRPMATCMWIRDQVHQDTCESDSNLDRKGWWVRDREWDTKNRKSKEQGTEEETDRGQNSGEWGGGAPIGMGLNLLHFTCYHISPSICLYLSLPLSSLYSSIHLHFYPSI